MHKIYSLFLLCLLAIPVEAETVKTDYTKINERASQFVGEDFANQSVLKTFYTDNSGKATLCQALRITPTWYLTAAHCVYRHCGGGKDSCLMEIDLLQCGTLKASARVEHLRSHSQVFIHPQYHLGAKGDDLARTDMALVHFKPSEKDYWLYDVVNRHPLTYKEFLQALNRAENRDCLSQWSELEKSYPKLLEVSNNEDRRITQPLAVPNFSDAEGKGLASGMPFLSNAVDNFYCYKKGLALTNPLRGLCVGDNFGLKQGKSGSGVVMHGGAVIGVVSLGLHEDDKSLVLTPFSPDNRKFIENTIRQSLSSDEKMPNFERFSGHYSEIVE